MSIDPDALLALLRDPNAESQQIADAAQAPREEVGRAARLVLAIGRAKPEEVVGLSPNLALAALRAALAAGRADVLAAAAASPQREVAKEAKRGLHVLRTRGVAVPELPRSAPPPPAAAVEPEPPCFVSSIDGQGERAVWHARNVAGKGVEVARAIVSDVRGLSSLQVGMLGRKEYRTFASDLLARGDTLGVAEVARELAHAHIADGRRRAEATGQTLPEGAALWLSRLGDAGPLPDPAPRFPPLPPEEERAALAGSEALHRLPLLRGWLADEEALRAAAARLDEIAVSPLLLDDAQRAEQSSRVVADALAAWLDEPRRALWARRLLAVAGHLADGGDAASAAQAAAVARALAAGVPAADIPFARGLFEKALPAAVPPGDAPPRSLIVPPR